MKVTSSDSLSQSWFRSANCDDRYGAALLAAVLLLLGLGATGEWGRQTLDYDRGALANFQWWRLLSAHLVHLSWEHVLLNCGGLILLWALFAREYSPRRWLWIIAAAMLAIDGGLWFLRPTVDWYLGASGVLHGVLAAGAYALYRRGETMGAVLLLLLVVKLVYEQQSGGSLFAGDLPLVPDAHVLGALGGLFAAFLPRSRVQPASGAKSLTSEPPGTKPL
jgi:rhomboid family GlyGly-CTERM serine protease